MEWIVCLCLSLGALVAFGFTAGYLRKRRYRKNKIATSLNLMFLGVGISATLLFIPLYYHQIMHGVTLHSSFSEYWKLAESLLNNVKDLLLSGEYRFFEVFLQPQVTDTWDQIWEPCSSYISVFFAAVQHALRLFALEGDFYEFFIASDVFIEAGNIGLGMIRAYYLLGTLLYLLAPLLTFTALISFFKNLLAYLRYRWWGGREVHVFSELNPKSLALAKSIIDEKLNVKKKDSRKEEKTSKRAEKNLGKSLSAHQHAWAIDDHCYLVLDGIQNLTKHIEGISADSLSKNPCLERLAAAGNRLEIEQKTQMERLQKNGISVLLDKDRVPCRYDELKKQYDKLLEELKEGKDSEGVTKEQAALEDVKALALYYASLDKYLRGCCLIHSKYQIIGKKCKKQKMREIAEFCNEIAQRCTDLCDACDNFSKYTDAVEALCKTSESSPTIDRIKELLAECQAYRAGFSEYTYSEIKIADEGQDAMVNAMHVQALTNKIKQAVSALMDPEAAGKARQEMDILVKQVQDLTDSLDAHFGECLRESERFEDRAIGYDKTAGECLNRLQRREQYKQFKKRIIRPFSNFGIIFTDVLEKNEEEHYDLVEEAKELGAVLFRTDLDSISFSKGKDNARNKSLNFYLISEDESEKMRHALSIMKKYPYANVTLYVFSETDSSKLLLGAKDQIYPKVVRVHDHQSLVYHNLNNNGYRLFEYAHKNEAGSSEGDCTISAMVVGLGKYGKEMLKALAWYCQVPGYKIEIFGFDSTTGVVKTLQAECPGLKVEAYDPEQDLSGGIPDIPCGRYEERYGIRIFSDVDVNSQDFYDRLDKISRPTYVFVCLGTDDLNISTAASLREYYERTAKSKAEGKPQIETVVYDSNLNARMRYPWCDWSDDVTKSGLLNYKDQDYQIHMIGSTDEFYTVDTMLKSDLETAGLMLHREYSGLDMPVAEKEDGNVRPIDATPDKSRMKTRYGKKLRGKKLHRLYEKRKAAYDVENQSFWKYEYNYRSSLAQKMFSLLIDKLNESGLTKVDGWNKTEKQRTEQEHLDCQRVEHVRWLVYMKTEGYRYAPERNDLAKHHDKMTQPTERYPDKKEQSEA